MKTALWNCLVIGSAGFFGSIARFVVGRAFHSATLPVGTLIINISGCFILGWFMTLMEQRGTVSETTRLAVTVGFVGAFTTFSTYVYESHRLLLGGSGIMALLYLQGSLALGLLAMRLGVVVAEWR